MDGPLSSCSHISLSFGTVHIDTFEHHFFICGHKYRVSGNSDKKITYIVYTHKGRICAQKLQLGLLTLSLDRLLH